MHDLGRGKAAGGDLLAASLNADVLWLPIRKKGDLHGHRPPECEPLAWPMAAAHPAHPDRGSVCNATLGWLTRGGHSRGRGCSWQGGTCSRLRTVAACKERLCGPHLLVEQGGAGAGSVYMSWLVCL